LPSPARTVSHSSPESMRVNINPLIKFCCTRPDSYRDDPAAETKSIGLPADASASWRNTNSLNRRVVRYYSLGNRQPVTFIDSHHDTEISSIYRDLVICQFYLDMSGLPSHLLAYDNSLFCIFKFTKPAHEHHLQVSCPFSSLYTAYYQDLKLQHLTLFRIFISG
jgi:hypothetical protein